jgi:beta-glucosidase
MIRYTEGVEVGYRYYDNHHVEPLFPFGFGLSYTSFDYRNLKLSTATLSGTAPSVTVDFDIVNTGNRDGAEVAQVYVGMPAPAGVVQPLRQLKGFARVAVSSGKTTHATIVLDARAFSYWDVATHGWKIAPGDYSISVGKSSRDIVLSAHVHS